MPPGRQVPSNTASYRSTATPSITIDPRRIRHHPCQGRTRLGYYTFCLTRSRCGWMVSVSTAQAAFRGYRVERRGGLRSRCGQWPTSGSAGVALGLSQRSTAVSSCADFGRPHCRSSIKKRNAEYSRDDRRSALTNITAPEPEPTVSTRGGVSDRGLKAGLECRQPSASPWRTFGFGERLAPVAAAGQRLRRSSA